MGLEAILAALSVIAFMDRATRPPRYVDQLDDEPEGIDFLPAFLLPQPGVPIFDGMPQTLPAGVSPIETSGPRPGEPGTWEPRPTKFAQFRPLQAGMLPNRRAEYVTAFMNRFYFWVSEGGVIRSYALGTKRINSGECCESAIHEGTTVSGIQMVRREGSSGWAPPPFVCESRPAECFDIIPRPFIAWPLLQTTPPPPARQARR